MKKVEDVSYYKCEFCGKISTKASAMVMHERHCHNNPHNDCLCLRCGWAVSGKADGEVEKDGSFPLKASALLSYCVKHKEFMCLRQSQYYADGVTNGAAYTAKYADEGCSDFTNEFEVPYAYELGFSMQDLVNAECAGKNVDDVICDLLKQMPDASCYGDLQSFIEQLQKNNNYD